MTMSWFREAINLEAEGVEIPEDFGEPKYATIRKKKKNMKTPWGYAETTCGQYFLPNHDEIDALKIAIELCKTASWGAVSDWLTEVTGRKISRELLRSIFDREREKQHFAKYHKSRRAQAIRRHAGTTVEAPSRTIYARKDTGETEAFVNLLGYNRQDVEAKRERKEREKDERARKAAADRAQRRRERRRGNIPA